MKVKFITLLMTVLLFCSMRVIVEGAGTGGDVPRMTTQELNGRLGDADVVVVDVRSEGSWTGSEFKIKSAVREDPSAVQSWLKKYSKEKTIVFYCS